jgi:hypothetical protein
MKNRQHVIPFENGWAVRSEDEEKISSFHNTQMEAVEAARKIAKKDKTEIVIHRKNESIQDLNKNANSLPSIDESY